MSKTIEDKLKDATYGVVPLRNIFYSKTNPRKRIDQAHVESLGKSILTHGLMQPPTLRQIPQMDGIEPAFEVVIGECRVRGCHFAELKEIRVLVAELTDIEVMELQLIENQKRQDVHPLEEAEGYQRLMTEARITPLQIGKRLNLSKSYVIGRLKLLALCEEARDALYKALINASTAVIIARIPVASLQKKACAEIVDNNGTGEPMSYRAAVAHIKSRYMLNLNSATFPITNGKLVPGCGTCSACPKRTGNDSAYEDIDPMICTDPDCWEQKQKAHAIVQEQTAKTKAVATPSLEAPEPENEPTVALDDATDTELETQSTRREIVCNADKKAAVKEKNEALAAKLRQARSKAETAYRVALYFAIRKQLSNPANALEALREVAKIAAIEWSTHNALSSLYKFNIQSTTKAQEFIDGADTNQLICLLLDYSLGNHAGLDVTEYEVDITKEEPLYDDNLALLHQLCSKWEIEEAVIRKSYLGKSPAKETDAPNTPKEDKKGKTKTKPDNKPSIVNTKHWPFPTSQSMKQENEAEAA